MGALPQDFSTMMVIVKLVNKTLNKAAENTSRDKISKLRDEKSGFYGILPFVIVCTQKQNSWLLSKQDSFSMAKNS
jgi:hypothetical protein